MCEAHAFLIKNGHEEPILENVDQILVEGDIVRLVNIFGEQKSLKAKIQSYNNPGRKILLKSLA